MYTLYGIWIDHRSAAIVKSSKLGEMSVQHVSSDVEPHIHGSGESNEHLTIANQHRHEERRQNEMKAFCREVLKHVMDADELVIFGPGTAKFDMKHEIEDHKVLAEKLKGVETTDQLSEAELKEYLKGYFKLPRD